MESVLKAPELLHWLNWLFRHHKVKLLLVLIQVEFEEGTEMNCLVFISPNVTSSKFWPRLAWLFKKFLPIPSPVIMRTKVNTGQCFFFFPSCYFLMYVGIW